MHLNTSLHGQVVGMLHGLPITLGPEHDSCQYIYTGFKTLSLLFWKFNNWLQQKSYKENHYSPFNTELGIGHRKMSVSTSSGGIKRKGSDEGEGGIKRKALDEGKGTQDRQYVEICITDQNDRRMYFKVNPVKPLSLTFEIYCERCHLEYSTLQFLYNGCRVHGKYTPKKLKMKNGDEILAVKHVDGGSVAALSF
ncbi:hypothetical protein AHAS_Ahas13G0007100 [Arachis hypogaea]